jgi:DNA integrity scanning protein DisA with diadenylate cyclase activity
MLEFAVHDLGARGIGAILVYRPEDDTPPTYEIRLPTPPALRIMSPSNLAPLRHVLSQVDGAAIFDADGTLRELGVRLVPSAAAETDVEGYRGMRHTSGRRYSFDDRQATVIVVSEDGPVTVLRKGHLLGTSTTSADPIND